MKRLSGEFDDVAQRWSVLRVREQVTTGFGGGNAEIREEVVLEVGIDYNIELFTLLTLSNRNTNFTIERGRALFVEWTILVSIISPESSIISPRADYETHNQP